MSAAKIGHDGDRWVVALPPMALDPDALDALVAYLRSTGNDDDLADDIVEQTTDYTCTCTECGRTGNVEDMCYPGESCPDEECHGTCKLDGGGDV